MNNTLKLLVLSMLAVGLVACINDVGGNANNQKPLQKVSQNESNNLATVQSDAKGGVVISKMPTVGNQNVVIKLIPVDASNEGRYIEYSLPRVVESGAYSSSASVLMPHRQYKVQVEGLNQGESLKLSFKKYEALSDVAAESVPPIFAGVMTRAGVFNGNLYVKNGKLYHATNGQNNISNILVLNNNVITPFYAGNINIVNESGDSVAQVKVGEYTNPVFENDLVPNAKHPLLGSPYNASEGYKFSMSDGDNSSQGISSFADEAGYHLLTTEAIESNFSLKFKQMIPRKVRKAEGRYWPDNLFETKTNHATIGINWVDYYKSYSTFTTTLPVPIDFVALERRNASWHITRYCVTNISYAIDGIEVAPYPFKLKNKNEDGPSSPISKDTWSAANCFHLYGYSNHNEEDVGSISDYNRNSSEYNKSMRYAW